MKIKIVMAGMMMSLFVVPGFFSVAVQADMTEQENATIVNNRDRDAQGTHRALLVGINDYDPAYGASHLDCCINDALGVRSTILLADPGQRWSASLLQVLTNNTATASAIRTALQSLATASQSGDLVLYYHSSHGGQYSGTSVFLCAYDQDYSAVSLGQDLALFNSGATVIVMVDACHSGGLFKQADGWPFAEMTMQAYLEAKTKQYRSRGLAVPKDLGNNIAFMTACDYNQLSQEQGSHGLYTDGLINGCQNPAVDTNHDGLYQFSELHTYAAQVASAQNPDQTAQQFHETVLTSMVARSVGSVEIIPLAGDFDGDAKADPAIYNTSTWKIKLSTANYTLVPLTGFLGGSGYSAIAGDFDGDRFADPAVYQAATGTWLLKLSSAGYTTITLSGFLGDASYTALAADFDGDAKADPVVYQAATGTWLLKLSSAGYTTTPLSGFLGDTSYTALAADFDGDAKADPVVYQAATGTWLLKLSSAGYTTTPLSGFLGDTSYTALAADFDGDGKADPAVAQTSTGNWEIRLSNAGYVKVPLAGFLGE